VNWALSQFETVDEVSEALKNITVYGLDVPQIGVQPLHWAFKDAKGGSIVIEYVNKQLMVYENPIGVLTNAPTFDWHINNLRNHINLTNINVDGLTLGKTTLKPLGQGTGMLGIPGDYTPPSRFLRATALAFGQTQWVTVYDLKNKIAYFRTYGNLNIRQLTSSPPSVDDCRLRGKDGDSYGAQANAA
jgi:choloylglycine hydrolase